MSTFDELAIVYDNSIDWDSRLKRELPFLLESLPTTGQRRVLDMACGSGRHSVALSSEGWKWTSFCGFIFRGYSGHWFRQQSSDDCISTQAC
ncbi:MAG: hypothetical protein ACXAAP_14310 [Candidatus Thorarchaeota archaeon]